jgi:hypothetical protein
MSSKVHGDPATPVFQAYVGDPVRFRLLMGGDRGRAHSFLMHGHGWPNQPTDPSSMVRTNRGGVMAGNAYVFDLVGGAGGLQKRSRPQSPALTWLTRSNTYALPAITPPRFVRTIELGSVGWFGHEERVSQRRPR